MKKYLFLLIAFISHPPASYATDDQGEWLAKNLYPIIIEGNAERLLDAFEGEPNIDTPRTGAIRGKQAIQEFFAKEQQWLLHNGVDANSVSPIKTTQNEQRVVYEFNLVLNKDKQTQHKFGVVVDLLENKKASAVRVYYVLGKIEDREDFSRPSMLEENPALFSSIAAPVKQYVASIGNAYPDTASIYTEEGCFNAWCGINRHKIFIILMQGGTIPLKLTTATCDEMTCALEENLATWGETKFSFNTAGLAVYDYTPNGQLSNARIYDDLHEAPFTKAWFQDNWGALNKRFTKIGCAIDTPPQSGESADELFGRIFSQKCNEPITKPG